MFAAFCVGVSETLIGYPFLTVKTRIQNKLPWTHLKWHEYYRGVRYPLGNSLAFNMVVFPTHDYLAHTHSHFTAGALAGVAVTPQTFVIDTLAITRQINQPITRKLLQPKGVGTTLVREMLALGTYFHTYHAVREHTNSLVAGAAAGLTNWTLTYPLDVVRTRIIAQRIGIREALLQKQFWKGFHVVAARAMIVNAVSFTVYEQVKSIN